MKNITFSASEALIQKARKKAASENKVLNTLFRQWLKRYVGDNVDSSEFKELMKELTYAKPGRKFSRDEMNER